MLLVGVYKKIDLADDLIDDCRDAREHEDVLIPQVPAGEPTCNSVVVRTGSNMVPWILCRFRCRTVRIV